MEAISREINVLQRFVVKPLTLCRISKAEQQQLPMFSGHATKGPVYKVAGVILREPFLMQNRLSGYLDL